MNKKENILSTIAWSYLGILALLAAILPSFLTERSFPYDPNYMDLESTGGVAPGIKDHILGTDLLGKDVLSGLISGANVSLQVSLYAISFALIIAIILVFITTYIGNQRWKLNIVQLIFIFIFSIIGFYYLFISFPIATINSIIFRGLLFSIWIGFLLFISIRFFSNIKSRKIAIPMDELGLKFYELFYALPKLLFILLVMGLSPKNGIIQLSVLMGLLIWPVFYRYLRLEIIQLKNSNRFTSLQNLGLGDLRIIFTHTMPGIVQSITTPVLFTLISAILIEATLSFLGIGIAGDTVTWGKMLTQARLRVDAWWLAIFPGILIFFTLLSLNILIKKYIED